MNFRTEISIGRFPFILSPQKPIVSVGSCFSSNMAARMLQHGWEAVNPCGTLYNPLSILIALSLLIDNDKGKGEFEKSLFESDGLWHSHLFDSSFSSLNRNDCIEEFLLQQIKLKESLKAGSALIVTFGTSLFYHLKANGQIVGNCHKQLSSLYFRKRLTVGEIIDNWRTLHTYLRKSFPELKIIFTVSPVRHLKDGFIENAKSKAVLLLAVEELCNSLKDCFYFPAFEIMNDDLRDYRYYAGDMVHPSEVAIDYIWELFIKSFLNEEGVRLLREGKKLFQAQHHRPLTGALGRSLHL